MQSKTSEVFQKLSVDVKPQNYQLTVCPNLETFLFEGTVVIDLKVMLNFFSFHSIKIHINKVLLKRLLKLVTT